jgi:hypothetical protein
MTGDFRASTINVPLYCVEIVTANTPITRKNNSRLCSINLSLKGRMRTARATITRPATIPQTGSAGIPVIGR